MFLEHPQVCLEPAEIFDSFLRLLIAAEIQALQWATSAFSYSSSKNDMLQEVAYVLSLQQSFSSSCLLSWVHEAARSKVILLFDNCCQNSCKIMRIGMKNKFSWWRSVLGGHGVVMAVLFHSKGQCSLMPCFWLWLTAEAWKKVGEQNKLILP